jgi:hypothetical protein
MVRPVSRRSGASIHHLVSGILEWLLALDQAFFTRVSIGVPH